jgi:hypothetical protein
MRRLLASSCSARTAWPRCRSLANTIAADVAAVMSDKGFQEKDVDPFGFKIATETLEAFRAFLQKDKEIQEHDSAGRWDERASTFC